MSNVLVINAGSTSIKYKLFSEDEVELAAGQFQGQDVHRSVKQLLRQVVAHGDIAAVGHRVVHGGSDFVSTTIVTDSIMAELKKLDYLAPLHNPFNLAGIESASDFLPTVPQVAVFDTAFFSGLPDVAKTYALPREISEKYGIRRFGFHGISHEFVLHEAAKSLDKKFDKINIISCHLGGGCSVAAIKQGKPIDISNGYTPTEGLVMQTRVGDIDPGVVIELLYMLPGEVDKEKIASLYDMLNHESGIKGLTGGISDFRDLLREVSLGQPKAQVAFDIFVYKIIKYIGSYWAALEGVVDAIVFTGAVGSGNPLTRQTVMRRLKHLSEVIVLPIVTNEELNIARKVRQIIK